MKKGQPRPSYLTPAIILMREHYRQSGLDQGWSWQQVVNLCALMKITEHELFALYGMDDEWVRRFRKRDRVPPPIAIHFHILQGWHVQKTLGTEPKPVIPADLLVY